jgi:4-hydroxybenzoate polyprenyltransferase
MLINDYFDYLSGADAVNAPQKPLPSGAARADIAVLLAGSM